MRVRVQLAAAAAERGRIRARRLHVLALHAAEARVLRRRNRRAERRVGDDAARSASPSGRAGCFWNAPPTSLPFGTGRLVPSSSAEISRDCTGLPSISLRISCVSTPEPCEWPIEHDAAAVVVVLQVVVPRVEHVVVGRARDRPCIGVAGRSRRAAPSASTCRYSGAKSRHCDAKRANCARTTPFSSGPAIMSLLPPGRSRPSDTRRSSRSARSGSAFHVLARQRAVRRDDRRGLIDGARVLARPGRQSQVFGRRCSRSSRQRDDARTRHDHTSIIGDSSRPCKVAQLRAAIAGQSALLQRQAMARAFCTSRTPLVSGSVQTVAPASSANGTASAMPAPKVDRARHHTR